MVFRKADSKVDDCLFQYILIVLILPENRVKCQYIIHRQLKYLSAAGTICGSSQHAAELVYQLCQKFSAKSFLGFALAKAGIRH